MSIDLMKLVEQGGCSAKLPPDLLDKIVNDLPFYKTSNLMVGTETHDDAAVWKLDNNQALIYTTDFFPPMCSDPYDFGQIAAANALSDVYAMGGTPFLAMNLVMFPKSLDVSILQQILQGGADKIKEAETVLCGGHTIEDQIPKYGLAVSGIANQDEITTNSAAKVGDVLIYTKQIGTGVILAGKKLNEVSDDDYQNAIASMKQLNNKGASIMRKYKVKSATDITGFGLLGHALKMAKASNVELEIHADKINFFPNAYQLAELGCIPGAAFRNLKYVSDHILIEKNISYSTKMLLCDAQTSGGLLISASLESADQMLIKLHQAGYMHAEIIGSVRPKAKYFLHIV